MAIPNDEDAWYLAVLVIEIRVAGAARNVVHTNYVLVRASSADAAYAAALELGRQEEQTYANTAGQEVRSSFRGLHELLLIHEAQLDHGAELFFDQTIGLPEARIAALVRAQAELSVFRPPPQVDTPNYAAKDIVAELERDGSDGGTADGSVV